VTAPDPSDETASFTVATGLKHTFVVKLKIIRIRLLDRFGDPCKETTCEVDVPAFRKSSGRTDDKGWLEVRCPKTTEYVDLILQGVVERDAKRRVFLKAAWKDEKGTMERLSNLGFSGGESAECVESFRHAHGLDTVAADLAQHLDRIESDYKSVDDPRQHETGVLDQSAGNLGELGERT
jgi:hypothetical protein